MTMQTTQQALLIHLTINGQAVAVPKGTTVYHAATDLGFELPVFCYHDRMPPFGACRVCLVEVEKMNKLQTSCTLEVAEGMVVNTQSYLAVQGREEILEFLLINHPLDCPVCDKGGECPLQDQTVAFGPGRSNFYEEKRHFPKPIALGSVLMLDRERCIICARCTRFGDIVAGDHALEFIDRGFRTEVGTPGGKPVESKFIGNTILLCPVGALTSGVYRFRARPWDNEHIATACTLCPVGCSMVLDQRDGEIMRTRSCENKEINDIWMCDKGWFGYEFASYRARLQKPLIRRNGKLELASWDEALSLVATKMKEAKSSGKMAGWGGNPLTTEENFYFQKLIRESSGSNNVDHRIGMPIFSLYEEGIASGMEMSIAACEHLSQALLLGLDLTEEFPVIWLRLKIGINSGGKAYFTGHYAPEMADHLHGVKLHAPGEEIKVLHSELQKLADKFKKINESVDGSEKIAIFVGRQYLASPHRAAILRTLTSFQQAYPHVSLNLLEGRGNSIGARLAGMHPELGPFGEKLPKGGLNAIEVLEAAAGDGWDFLYVAGADPARKFPTRQWREAKSKMGFLVVQDLFLTETARQADVVLPSLCFVEKKGTFVNIAQRVQALQPGKKIPEEIFSDAKIFQLVAELLGFTLTASQALEELKPGHLVQKAKRDMRGNTFSAENKGVAPSSIGEGRLLATFAHALFDRGERMKHNPHLLQMVKEPHVRLNALEAAKRGVSSGERVRLKAGGNVVVGLVEIDRKVADGTLVLPLGFDEFPVQDLAVNLLNGLLVELEKDHF